MAESIVVDHVIEQAVPNQSSTQVEGSATKKTKMESKESKATATASHDDDASTVVSDKKGAKNDKDENPKKKKPKIRRDVQEKIMAYMGQELQTDRKNMSKQEVAEGCGYAKAGAHGFHYAWQDLEKTQKWVAKSGTGTFCLTDLGKDHIPTGIVLVSKKRDNKGKQEAFLQTLLKQCKEAKEDKMVLVFEILSDGQQHTLAEFTEATGYANLKSKGLGYPFTHMEKKMKILERPEKEVYKFADKCFPEGRPV